MNVPSSRLPPDPANDWETLRRKFQQSLLADTPLASLAQNLDQPDWPLRGEDERPAKYIDYTWAELAALPEFAGHESRREQLVGILRETLAFDDPFSEMVAQADSAAAQDNPILKTLVRLGIPVELPLSLVNLAEDTRVICAAEGARTIGEFATLGQQLALRVVLGGDFRAVLNALTAGDEREIARYVPYRPGVKGVHLPEALGRIVDRLPRTQQLALGRRLGAQLTAAESAGLPVLTGPQADEWLQRLQPDVTAVWAWFQDETKALQASMAAGQVLSRHFVVLDDAAREAIAINLAESRLALHSRPSQPMPPVTAVPPPAGAVKKRWFARWFGAGR